MEKNLVGKEIVKWQESLIVGFHGIVTRPDGVEGIYIKDENSFSWFGIGKKQDPLQLTEIVRQIHVLSRQKGIDLISIRNLREEAGKLGQPKVQT
jgi:hypothetical protein